MKPVDGIWSGVGALARDAGGNALRQSGNTVRFLGDGINGASEIAKHIFYSSKATSYFELRIPNVENG